MKKNKIIRINLLTNIAAVPNDDKAIDDQRKKGKALMDLCEKLEQKYNDEGIKVEITIIPYNDIENRKKTKNEFYLLIDSEKYDNIENEINKTVKHLRNNLFKRIKDFFKVKNRPAIINLFVVCPKDLLNKEKEQISEICQKLNNKYAADETGQKFKIAPVTYYNPENREDVSNKNIKKADIVLFLVDKISDDNDPLVENIKLAIDRNNSFKKPEPVVFVSNESDNNTFEEATKILAAEGWMPEPYRNTKDLLKKVEYKIERYAHLYNKIKESQIKSSIWYYGLRIASVLFVLLVALLALRPYIRDKVESRQLLIMGGGSAINYIVDNSPNLKSKNDLNTLLWHYAAMPSAESYGIIAEEVIKNYDGYKNHPYYPIVLSARQAKQKDFLKVPKIEKFQETGIIIGIWLGYDWLVAYGSKNAFPNEMIATKPFIQVDSLKAIIAKQVLLLESRPDSTVPIHPINIFTTSKNSGTLLQYQSICDSSIIKYNNIEHLLFSDIDTISKQSPGKEWIALGSKYYHPINEDWILLTVFDSHNNKVNKDIYIYFMLYWDGDKYILPKATKKFLKNLQILPDSTIDSIGNPSIISSIINDSTILYDTIFKFHKSQK